MKVYFEKHDLIIEAESYEENIALETWSDVFFKRMDYNKECESGYFLLCTLYKPKEITYGITYEQK